MLIEIADAIVTALNDHTFSLGFTAERDLVAEVNLEELETLHVTVVPRGTATTILDRARDLDDVQIDVAVRQRVDAPTNALCDPLLALVEEIKKFLSRKPMAGALWTGTKNAPIYSPVHLREASTFFSVLTLSYKVAGT